MASAKEEPVCNIDAKGLATRTRAARTAQAALALLAVANAADAHKPFLQDVPRVALWGLIEVASVGAFLTQEQVTHKTCIKHALARTEQEGSSTKPVLDPHKAEVLRARAVRMIARSTVLGTAVAVGIIGLPYVVWSK